MLYLAIDQHHKQLTVNLRNEEGRGDVPLIVKTDDRLLRNYATLCLG